MNNFIKYLIIITVIIIIFSGYLFSNKNTETFNNYNIISIYSPYCFFGFGDYIRGLIYLYQKTDKLIIADYRSHPISKYLYNSLIKNYPEYSSDEIKILPVKIDNSHDILLNDKNNIIITNSMYSGNVVDEQIIEKIKNTFVMKPKFKIIFNNKLKKYNLENDFFALHIRLDDKYFDDNEEIPYFEKLHNFIDQTFKPEDKVFVLSNCTKIKDQICNKYNFIQYKIKPTHTGEKINITEIKNTLIEFFTLSMAKKIYYFCDNDWQISGFSKRVSEMYNIEYIHV
jgi:hypothetical protein